MFRAPSLAGLPQFSTMLDDIPATPAQVAAHLEIRPSTLATYKRTNSAPRAIALALFWETRWGRSAADCEAANAVQVHQGYALSLKDHVQRLSGIIWTLEQELALTAAQSEGRAANGPIYRIR